MTSIVPTVAAEFGRYLEAHPANLVEWYDFLRLRFLPRYISRLHFFLAAIKTTQLLQTAAVVSRSAF